MKSEQRLVLDQKGFSFYGVALDFYKLNKK